MTIVRRIRPGEGMLYKELRLTALRESPDAFTSTLEHALLRSDASWITQADQSAEGRERATFLMMDGNPVGLAALYRDDRMSDTTELIQMWIAPEHRQRGFSQELLSTAVTWARANGYRTIRAGVTPGNGRALRFYQKCGFVRIAGSSFSPGVEVMLEMDVDAASFSSPNRET